MSIVATLAPDIALIVMGVLISPLLISSIWAGLDRLSYYVLYPGLIFHAAASRPVVANEALSLGLIAASVVTAGLLLGLITRPLRKSSKVDFGGAVQNAYRFNTAFAFVAIGVLPAEAASVLAVMVGFAIPLANIYAVVGLTRGADISIKHVFLELITNPFLLASLGGLLVALSGKALPQLVTAFTGRIADAALPLVLIAIGAALRGARLWPLDQQAIALHTIRLVILPLGVLGIALVFGLRGVTVATVLLFAAVPTTSAAHVLASRYGADRSDVALIVTHSTLAGLLTLPVWAWAAVKLAS